MSVDMTPEQAEAAEKAARYPVSPTCPDKHCDVAALGHRVLAVAHLFPIAGDWRCYIDAVPGEQHAREFTAVLRHGDKVPESIAREIFPQFKHLTYWKY